MKSFVAMGFLVLVAACGNPSGFNDEPPLGSLPKNKSHHDITQLQEDSGTDAGVLDVDAGPAPEIGGDARIAVAYCAASILDVPPKLCSTKAITQVGNALGLETDCNTGLTITWNCDRCGDVSKSGVPLGHVLMTTPERFEVTSVADKAGHVCTLDASGAGFTVGLLE